MHFTMNRNHVLSSTMGHSIEFKKDEPVHVPKEMHKEAIMAGAVAYDGEVNFAKPAAVSNAPENPDERAEMLKMALLDMRDRNVRDEFTATGVPKVKAVEKIVGFDTNAAEVTELWTALNQTAA